MIVVSGALTPAAGILKILSVFETNVLLHRVVSALDRAGDRFLRAEFGISHSRIVVMLLLHRGGPTDQHDLAVKLGVTDPAISGLVRELVRDGRVSISADPTNRRRRVVSLTAPGAELVDRAGRYLEERFAALLVASDVDNDVLFALLSRIDKTLSQEGT
jgi:DNA-binding MarR family transcriptional regulator